MRVYISMDMEGVAGITHREQTNPLGYDYGYARHLMIAECNAVVQGCVDAGADYIVVSDSHGGNGCKTMLAEELHPAADLVTGSPRPHGQLCGLDDSFDAVMMPGYHVRHGAFGVLNHTLNGQTVARLTVNGVEVGEVGSNAGLAGHFGVPVVLVSGDDVTVAEAKERLPWIEGAVVKWAVSRYAERAMHPHRAQQRLRKAAAEALRNLGRMQVYRVAPPVVFVIRFKDTGMAEAAAQIPGTELIDPQTLRVTAGDYSTAFTAYSAAVDLGSTTRR